MLDDTGRPSVGFVDVGMELTMMAVPWLLRMTELSSPEERPLELVDGRVVLEVVFRNLGTSI